MQARLEEISGAKFNSCLLNLYRDGQDHMSWHSDNEKLYGDDPVIGVRFNKSCTACDAVCVLYHTFLMQLYVASFAVYGCSLLCTALRGVACRLLIVHGWPVFVQDAS